MQRLPALYPLCLHVCPSIVNAKPVCEHVYGTHGALQVQVENRLLMNQHPIIACCGPSRETQRRGCQLQCARQCLHCTFTVMACGNSNGKTQITQTSQCAVLN